MTALILKLALSVSLAATAIILHELAHGYAAWALGDQTARRAGRLSLLPWRHVDRFGTIILPGVLLASQLLTVGRVLFMFGWAKPVPVDPSGFRSPRRGMALVAVAGPLMNFSLAFLSALVLAQPEPSGRRGVGAGRLHRAEPRARPVQPRAHPAAGRRPHRRRPAAPSLGPRLGRAGALRHRLVLLLIAGPALLRQIGIEFDPLGHTLLPGSQLGVRSHPPYLAGVPIRWTSDAAPPGPG